MPVYYYGASPSQWEFFFQTRLRLPPMRNYIFYDSLGMIQGFFQMNTVQHTTVSWGRPESIGTDTV